jgi:hypothetical protein
MTCIGCELEAGSGSVRDLHVPGGPSQPRDRAIRGRTAQSRPASANNSRDQQLRGSAWFRLFTVGCGDGPQLAE